MVLAAQGAPHRCTAALGWLRLAAARGDVWALLLLAARHWEEGEGEGSPGSGPLQQSYGLAAECINAAAQLMQRQSEEAAQRARRRRQQAAAPSAAAAPSFQLQCAGGECRLAPLPPGSASGATPADGILRLVQPGGASSSAGVLGSYDAVAGGDAGWHDLQRVCRAVGEVVSLEGGLEHWALLEALHEEEARQAAARMLRAGAA